MKYLLGIKNQKYYIAEGETALFNFLQDYLEPEMLEQKFDEIKNVYTQVTLGHFEKSLSRTNENFYSIQILVFEAFHQYIKYGIECKPLNGINSILYR